MYNGGGERYTYIHVHIPTIYIYIYIYYDYIYIYMYIRCDDIYIYIYTYTHYGYIHIYIYILCMHYASDFSLPQVKIPLVRSSFSDFNHDGVADTLKLSVVGAPGDGRSPKVDG